jgi:hypothetical protein
LKNFEGNRVSLVLEGCSDFCTKRRALITIIILSLFCHKNGDVYIQLKS